MRAPEGRAGRGGPFTYLRPKESGSRLGHGRAVGLPELQGPDPLRGRGPRQLHFPGCVAAERAWEEGPPSHTTTPRRRGARHRGAGPQKLHFPGSSAAAEGWGRKAPFTQHPHAGRDKRRSADDCTFPSTGTSVRVRGKKAPSHTCKTQVPPRPQHQRQSSRASDDHISRDT